MKHHTQYPLPIDSAWDRKTWRRYAPIWFKEFLDGIKNLIDWLPVIWRDRHWDDHYIFEVLKRKLLLQRNYLVKHNRHTRIPQTNRDITICLNLIERIQDEYYELEMYDYKVSNFRFEKIEGSDLSEFHIDEVSDDLDKYFALHRASVKKCLKKNRVLSINKHILAREVAHYKQDQCHKLLFRILSERMTWWWD